MIALAVIEMPVEVHVARCHVFPLLLPLTESHSLQPLLFELYVVAFVLGRYEVFVEAARCIIGLPLPPSEHIRKGTPGWAPPKERLSICFDKGQ